MGLNRYAVAPNLAAAPPARPYFDCSARKAKREWLTTMERRKKGVEGERGARRRGKESCFPQGGTRWLLGAVG